MNSADPFELIVSEHYEARYRVALSLSGADAEARYLTQHTCYVWETKDHQLRDLIKVGSTPWNMDAPSGALVPVSARNKSSLFESHLCHGRV
jgi:hypothetical protein